MPGFARTLIYLGVLLVVVGVILSLAGRLPWLGNLPGDITVHRGRFTFYFPVTTCIILSLLISLVLYFFKR